MSFPIPAPLIVMALAVPLVLATPAFGQETRVAAEGHVPPPAQIEDVAWLAGDWSGPGIQSAPAHETWLPPGAETMVGLFVQENGEGGLMFTEHMYISEVDGSLAVRLKHFNPDLTGWEEREEMVTFRLVALEPCAAYFSGLTYRCINGDNTDDGILVAVRMHSDGPEVEELVFRFAPAGEVVRAPDVALRGCHINARYERMLCEHPCRAPKRAGRSIGRRR